MAGRNPSRGPEGPGGAWDLNQIRDLIDLLVEREISEFEMEQGGLKVRIKRGNPHVSTPMSAPAAIPPAVLPVLVPTQPTPTPAGASGPLPAMAPVSAGEPAEELHLIKSPIVGTFFSAPTPHAPPFVKVGDPVEEGQALCIIEAMKLMNEIESDVAGEVVKIFAENGQPVEYGQSLFAINPLHKE